MTRPVLEHALEVASRGARGAAFADGSHVHVALEPAEVLAEDDPSRAIDRFADAVDRWSSAGSGPEPHAFGWLGYDAARGDEPGADSDSRPRADRAPRAYLARYDSVLSVELATGAITLRGDAAGCERLRNAWAESAVIRDALPRVPLATRTLTDETRHRNAVETVLEHIRAGDVYLVNVARAVHAPAGLDPAQLVARIAASRAPFASYFDAGSVRVGGMSMELALAWDRATGTLETRPIKGTRPRGRDETEDEALALELARDPKERAENVMAVDVHRNDLGRIAAWGTVSVPALCVVEHHAFVHHLVSTVRARVRDDVSTAEVLRAMLPVGSVTGAPKRSAMQTIARIEPERRGVYTGVYGAVGRDGSLRLAVAIRTVVCDPAGAHYGAGGGIVIDSVPAREWDELSWKERAFAGR